MFHLIYQIFFEFFFDEKIFFEKHFFTYKNNVIKNIILKMFYKTQISFKNEKHKKFQEKKTPLIIHKFVLLKREK